MVFQKAYLDSYYSSVNFVQQNQLWLVPIDKLTPQRQSEAEIIGQTYHAKRNFVSASLARFSQIAEGYGTPEVTSYLLSSTVMPDYNTSHPNFFVGEDFNIWNDGMQRMLGAIKFRKEEERKKITNPFNWPAFAVSLLLYLPISILKSAGLKSGKFWDTFTDLIAKVIVLALILIVGYHYFGVTKPDIKNVILRYVGVGGESKSEEKRDGKPIDKTEERSRTPAKQ